MPGKPELPPSLKVAWRRLSQRLTELAPLVVAYSGGVDSSLLLAAVSQTLGPGVKAVLCGGPFTPPWEARRARELARDLGAELIEVDVGELDDPLIAANDPERCYHCKRRRLQVLGDMARQWGCQSVVEGSQADDALEHRPGSRAVRELGVHSPLAEAGLGKAQVRALSRALGLATAEAPSSACLATRLATGTPLTTQALERIGRAEEAVRQMLPGQLRVRDHFPLARLEVEAQSLALLTGEPLRGRVLAALKALGYQRVCLDLEGYRTSGPEPQG